MPAPGIPDRSEFGEHTQLTKGQLVDLFVQLHRANKAGLHEDWRIGTADTGLLSWAVPKGKPDPGEKHLAVQQPLHDHAYGAWSGTIPEGHGAGEVQNVLKGRALITKVEPDGISFTTAHERYPQRFRLQQTDDKQWLLINTTKTEPTEDEKQHYKVVPQADVEKLFSSANVVQPKLDGSAEIVDILGDKIESLSFRNRKDTGGPIVHTERIGNPLLEESFGSKPTRLRAELYGVRGGKAIPAAELGGLLNATVERSLRQQEQRGIDLQHGVFDVLQHRGKDVSQLPYTDRLALLAKIVPKLPASFHVMPGTQDPAEQAALWEQIKSGKHPLTREGVVAHPAEGGVPHKAPLNVEADVLIRGVFPGLGGLSGTAAGGYSYSLPEAPDEVVGKVGTGLSRQDRIDMQQHPEEWVGRTARILAKAQFDSGAYRAPVHQALHEDVTQKAAFLAGYTDKSAGERWRENDVVRDTYMKQPGQFFTQQYLDARDKMPVRNMARSMVSRDDLLAGLNKQPYSGGDMTMRPLEQREWVEGTEAAIEKHMLPGSNIQVGPAKLVAPPQLNYPLAIHEPTHVADRYTSGQDPELLAAIHEDNARRVIDPALKQYATPLQQTAAKYHPFTGKLQQDLSLVGPYTKSWRGEEIAPTQEQVRDWLQARRRNGNPVQDFGYGPDQASAADKMKRSLHNTAVGYQSWAAQNRIQAPPIPLNWSKLLQARTVPATTTPGVAP